MELHSGANNLYLRVIKSLRTDVLNRTTAANHDWVSKVATLQPTILAAVTLCDNAGSDLCSLICGDEAIPSRDFRRFDGQRYASASRGVPEIIS